MGPEADDDTLMSLREARRILRAKIIHTLTIWPKLSPSMLQVGIGTSISPNIWKPILEQMIATGELNREERHAKSHIGRDQVYTILSLGDINHN
jgi:hypothetical protein